PDVLRMLRIGITFIVLAINRARDDMNIALAFAFGFHLLWWRGLRAGVSDPGSGFFGLLFFTLFLFLLGQILRVGIAGKCDRFAVRRPDRASRAPRRIGKDKRIAARHRQVRQLRGFGLAVFLACAQEEQIFSIWRPARRAVVIAFGQLMRLL